MYLKILTKLKKSKSDFKSNLEYILQNSTKAFDFQLKSYKDYVQFNHLITMFHF